MQGYKDGPPGDDYFRWDGPQWPASTKVKLQPFWTRDSCSWFTLAESTFKSSGVADTRLRFDLVLPALPEEVIEQVRGILHAADDIADPTGPSRCDYWTSSPPSR